MNAMKEIQKDVDEIKKVVKEIKKVIKEIKVVDHCIHEPIVVTGVRTKGITCNLGSARPKNRKCVILGPKMTYTAGLGSAEPSVMQKCKFAPPILPYAKHHPSPPFFAKTIGCTMGLLSCWEPPPA